MKLFNIFIAISLVIIVTGFLFFKDGFNKVQSTPDITGLNMDMLSYLDYSDTSLANAQVKGTSVLFFAATTWCQTCSVLEEEIIERESEIPGDVTILKVDYDNDRAMNQKWNVTSQHTLIILDQGGKEVKRWLGGGFDTLLEQLETI